MNRLLLVEDDLNLGASTAAYLAREGFVVEWAKNLAEARGLAASFRPELVLLDWMLPDGQGVDWLRELARAGARVPVILLTARGELVDKVLGLESGANDYVTKPYEPRELVARVRAQLRQASVTLAAPAAPAKALVRAGEIELDLGAREARFRGRALETTRMEFELLRLLCENPNRVFSREELLNQVWGYERFPTTRTVDTHILQLRQKLADELFETVRGVGYRLKI